MAKKNIPVHKLGNFTDIGFILINLEDNYDSWSNIDIANMEMHRDDYYMFMVMDKCNANIKIDFKDFQIKDRSIFYIFPGQVQSNLPNLPELKGLSGWGIAVESNLIDDLYRKVLTDNLLNHRSVKIQEEEFYNITQCLSIIQKELSRSDNSAIDNRVIISLLDAFIGMFSKIYQERQEATLNTNSRQFLITSEFRKLLSENFKAMKSPSQYAEALHISTSYLNEVVKKISGFSVSHWILEENMLEAKRLLYYSDMNAKEIAFALGYDDHTYFSRLFSNANGESPLKFRKKYRK